MTVLELNRNACIRLAKERLYHLLAIKVGDGDGDVQAIRGDWERKDDDHDQDSLKETFWHIWSWSSENWFLERKRR